MQTKKASTVSAIDLLETCSTETRGYKQDQQRIGQLPDVSQACRCNMWHGWIHLQTAEATPDNNTQIVAPKSVHRNPPRSSTVPVRDDWLGRRSPHLNV